MEKTGAATGIAGGGTLFTEPVLVVNQKARVVEIKSSFAVFDQNANQIAGVEEVGQSGLKKFFRVLGFGQLMSHRLEIVDMNGIKQLAVFKPFRWGRPLIQVLDANEQLVGTLTIKIKIGKPEFLLNVDGQHVGSLKAENLRGWNWAMVDPNGAEFGRITKTWEGLGRAMFTNADHYVVQIAPSVQGPLRAMVIASALTIDLVLKQTK